MSENETIIAILILFGNSLSLLATAFVIIAYHCNQKLRNDAEFSYILCICGSDFIWSVIMVLDSIFFLANKEFDKSICQFEGFCKVYFGIAEFLTIGAFCYILRDYVMRGSNLRSKYLHYILLCFSIPLIFALIPFIGNNYGHVNPISEDNCFIIISNQNWMIFVCFYIPLWAIFGTTCLFFFQAKRSLDQKDDVTPKMKMYLKCLFWYPVIILVCWLFITISRLIDVFGNHQETTFDYFGYPFIGLSGLLNSLLIAFTSIKNETDFVQRIMRKMSYHQKQVEFKQGSFRASLYDDIQ